SARWAWNWSGNGRDPRLRPVCSHRAKEKRIGDGLSGSYVGPHVNLHPGPGRPLGLLDQARGDRLIHVDFAAVPAHSRRYALDYQRHGPTLKRDRGGTGRGLAEFADNTPHGRFLLKSASDCAGSDSYTVTMMVSPPAASEATTTWSGRVPLQPSISLLG